MPNAPEQMAARKTLHEPHLPLARYRLVFEAREPILLPPFQGALWRGVFGNALNELSGRAAASGAAGADLYRYFFETPPPPDATKMRRYDAAPHPYIIAAEPNFEPLPFAPGDRIVLGLTLIGRGAEAARTVFEAFAWAAASGLGDSRGRAALVGVQSIWGAAILENRGPVPEHPLFQAALAESPPIPPMPETVEVHLVSPLRLTLDNRLVRPGNFRPGDLLRALLRRVSMLMTFHTGYDLETDFRALTGLAKGARMETPALTLATQTRWSATQTKAIKMDGLIGRFVLDMGGLAPLWPYLWLGQWVHGGKGTVMGLGAIHLREAEIASTGLPR